MSPTEPVAAIHASDRNTISNRKSSFSTAENRTCTDFLALTGISCKGKLAASFASVFSFFSSFSLKGNYRRKTTASFNLIMQQNPCIPLMRSGFDSRTRCHMWLKFIIGSRPCSEGFSPGTPVFLPPQNQHFQNPIRPGNSGEKSHPVDSTEIPLLLMKPDYLNTSLAFTVL